LAGKSAHSKAAPGFDRLADKVADKPTMDAVDRAYLARFTLGNVALEREVLELFAAQAPVYLQRLREANCIKAWREATHTIKGSASAIGARRLAHLAEMAEKVDVEADIAPREGHRAEAVAAVAIATEEACRFIARLYPAT
jgi:HPt (histidine-containing phosphotransfer) domain-containing protein